MRYLGGPETTRWAPQQNAVTINSLEELGAEGLCSLHVSWPASPRVLVVSGFTVCPGGSLGTWEGRAKRGGWLGQGLGVGLSPKLTPRQHGPDGAGFKDTGTPSHLLSTARSGQKKAVRCPRTEQQVPEEAKGAALQRAAAANPPGSTDEEEGAFATQAQQARPGQGDRLPCRGPEGRGFWSAAGDPRAAEVGWQQDRDPGGFGTTVPCRVRRGVWRVHFLVPASPVFSLRTASASSSVKWGNQRATGLSCRLVS